ncbi:MAG: hypothetical protein FWB93_01920 [Oscillospiraceae bacterium]|nr:hypothetical protein [Oscillospiraceae bacterium]
MNYWIIIGLFAVGLILLLLEAALPGFDFGISGVLGVVAIIGSSTLTIIHVDHGAFIVLAKIAFVALLLIAMRLYFRTFGEKKSLILADSLAEDPNAVSAPDRLAELKGRVGIAKTSLRPHGFAGFDSSDADIEVRSVEGYISAGSQVKVTSVVGHVVYVRKIGNN